MKNVFGAVLVCAMTVALAVSAAAQVDAEATDNGYTVSDAGALGVEVVNTDNIYCAADAGTLGHPNPVAACN